MSKEERKVQEEEEGGIKKVGEFEVLAEWTVRRLRPLGEEVEEDYTEKAKRWVLYSLGLDKLHQDIFLYLEKKLRTTTTDLAEAFNISPNTARKYLDELHTVGLVDYVGREYALTYESLSRAIELMLIPRITDTLRIIARGASSTDFPPYTPTAGVETGKIYEEKGVTRVNRRLLEGWQSSGKRVRIKSFGSLTIDDDVDPNLFDAIVERVDCFGSLRIPSEIYAPLSHKFRVYGNVDVH